MDFSLSQFTSSSRASGGSRKSATRFLLARFAPATRLTETVDYCAAARIGRCDLRKVRTRLIVRALSSGGSRHGKTVISELGASDATSIDVCSGCDDVSSGRTRIGVRQPAMNERGTL